MRRRRVWVRASTAPGGSRLQLAGIALQDRPAFQREFATLAEQVRARLEKLTAAADQLAPPAPAGKTRV